MAAAKKKKKEKSTSPNIALVIFLIFFILVTISMGVLVYYDQETMAKAAEDKRAAKAGWDQEKLKASHNGMVVHELRLILGDTLTEAEDAELKFDREQLKNGKFNNEKNKDTMKKFVEETKAKLGGGPDKDTSTTYEKEIKLANDKANVLAAQLAAALDAHAKTKKLYDDLNAADDTYRKDAFARIQKGNDAAFASTLKASKSVTDIVETSRKLSQDLIEAAEKREADKEEYDKIVKRLNARIALLEKEKLADTGVAAVQGNAPRNDAFPLLLDVSPGKPLWDHPVGRIMRVDPDLRQIAINVGTAQGAKPELTFNIFGGGSNGRPVGQLKGSLEIIRVVDANTSIARLNSLYDGEGKEIALNDVSRTRVLRETESPIREGDLLFNLFWGSRVAVVGYVNITGDPSDNPAEQIRQMEDFAYLLQRNGMQVDAYVDMRDGQVRGAITPKTRYIILGDDLRVAGGAKKKMDKEGDDKEPAAEQPGADRGKLINDANLALKKAGVGNGSLLVSQDNFAMLIGYRRARSANNPQLSEFRPSLPYAGAPGQVGVMDVRPREEKKDVEMKEKEAMKEKDAN